nr:unnamed protein product [Spirometra erinaceieuropaei]
MSATPSSGAVPPGQATRRGRRLRHPERHRGTTALFAAGHKRSPDEPPSASPGRQIRRHRQRLRFAMTGPDGARSKCYENLRALLASVLKSGNNELAQRLDNLPVAAATAADENACVENRRCQLWDTVQSTALAFLGRARRQHQD